MNANAKCQERREDIARLADILDMELAKQSDNCTWGMAGTLGMVHTLLIEAVEQCSGVTREQIETTLAEIA